MITKFNNYIEEKKITIDLEKGDEILTGRFKNKKRVVKKFGIDKNNQPTVNDKPMLNFRIKKLMNEDLYNIDLSDRIQEIISNFDNNFQKISKNLKVINYVIGEYKILFKNNFKAILYMNRKYNTLIIKNTVLNTVTNIEIDDYNFDNFLKDKIQLSFFLNCVSFYTPVNISVYKINFDNDDYYSAFDKVYNTDINVIKDLVINNLLPDDLQDKYNHLIDANNFNLL